MRTIETIELELEKMTNILLNFSNKEILEYLPNTYEAFIQDLKNIISKKESNNK